VAVVKLVSPVKFTDHISPICLPSVQDEKLPEPGTLAYIVGWGAIEWLGLPSPILRQTTSPIASYEKCKQIYGDKIYENVMFCAGHDQAGKGTCQGDSGGPLLVQDSTSGVWKQFGITSWSQGCGTLPKFPYGVYAKVPYFVDFIKKYVRDL